MEVVDLIPGSLFLTQSEDRLFVSVLVSRSFGVWAIQMELNDDEKQKYRDEGKQYLSELDKEVARNIDLYCKRQLRGKETAEISTAIKHWNYLHN